VFHACMCKKPKVVTVYLSNLSPSKQSPTFIVQQLGIQTLQGSWLDFNSRINSLAVCNCDTQLAGLCVSHDTQMIKVKRNDSSDPSAIC
jgi:hypothetical protein